MSEISHIIATRLPNQNQRGDRPKTLRISTLTREIVQEQSKAFGAVAVLVAPSILAIHKDTIPNKGVKLDNRTIAVALDNYWDIHDALNRAVTERDFAKIDSIADEVLQNNPIQTPSELGAIIHSICAFMQTWDGSVDTISRFATRIDRGQLAEFVNDAPSLVITLNSQIITTMAQRRLGDLDCDLISMSKSIAIFDIMARVLVSGKDPQDAPIQLMKALTGFELELPSFLFFNARALLVDATEKQSGLKRAVQSKDSHDAKLKAQRDGKDLCHCDCEEPDCTPASFGCPELQYFVADYFTLESKTKCYSMGDLAYLENIAAFETRNRTHSFEEKIVTTYEEVITEENRRKRDHTVTNRSTLQSTLERKRSLKSHAEGRYGKSDASYYLGKINLDASEVRKQIRTNFKEDVDKAITEINREAVTTRSEVVSTIEKEENTHSFSNKSKEPSRSKYFYVNRDVLGQVLSYDLRGQIEFRLPKPSMMFEYLDRKRKMEGFNQIKPTEPKISKDALNPDQHDVYVSTYGVQGVSAPPVQLPVLYEGVTMDKKSDPMQITIPAGYTATWLERTGGLITRNFPGLFARINMSAGGVEISFRTDSPGSSSVPLSATSQLTFTVNYKNAGGKAYITGRITMTPDPIDLSGWRDAMYEAIMAKYNDDLGAYNDALAEHLAAADGDLFTLHPLQLESIVRTEIKRAAIAMMCGDFETPNIVNLKSEPCGAPTINRIEADDYLRKIAFWEHAFDWELMMFHFLDYLFGHSACEWHKKFLPSHDVKMFSDFMSAGSARVLVPVAKGMEQDVAYFAQTGEIWGQTGTPPLDQNDPRYIDLITEILHSKNCFQTERDGRVTGIFDQTQSLPAMTNQVLLTGSDAYRDVNGTVDSGAIDADLNRYIYVDGKRYVIADIVPDPAANPPSSTQDSWIITLDRVFEGAATLDQSNSVFPSHPFAVGALLVGAPFAWTEPTNLVWIGDTENECLPCYPVEC